MEFKKLSDVEVVAEPTESANVLIEENGVIKKAPKTAVGGGGEWDAVIEIDDVYDVTTETARFIEGGFNAILKKIDANEVPRIKIIAHWEYGDVMKACVEPASCQYNVTVNGIDIYYCANWGELLNICVYSNGNIYEGNVSA